MSATVPVVPHPLSLRPVDDVPFTLAATSRVLAPGAAAPMGGLLAQVLRPATGFPLPVVDDADDDGAHVTLAVGPQHAVPGHEHAAEAYALSVTAEGVTISAGTAHGAYHGVQTLRQLFPPFIEHDAVTCGPWTVPAVEVVDAPRFGYRGIMLDVARSFLTVEEVKTAIDALTALKLNHLHLHLADDQGWRIEITNEGRAAGDDIDYSLLTSVSGRTAMTEGGYGDEPGRTGWYSQADYAEIVAYAAARYVVVVPEIDAPGHTQAALHAIPQLNTAGAAPAPDPATGTAPAHGTTQVGHSTLDTRSEVTYTFLRHVLGQLAALTPGPYLHVGGDESHATDPEGYVYFLDRVLDMVEELGKQAIGWNEYAKATLRPGDVVQLWDGRPPGTAELLTSRVRAGARLLASPATHAYLDMKYSPATPIGLDWTEQDDCDVDVYYDWDPVGIVPGVQEDQVLGVEGPLWSETVRGIDQAQHLLLPRAASVLEVGWSAPEHRQVPDFLARLAGLGGRLSLAGHNFFPSPKVAWELAVGGLETTRPAGDGDGDGVTLALVTAPGTPAEDLSATVDLGAGPLPATVVATRPADELNVGGPYHVVLGDVPAGPGSYSGTVVVSGPQGSSTAPVRLTLS